MVSFSEISKMFLCVEIFGMIDFWKSVLFVLVRVELLIMRIFRQIE